MMGPVAENHGIAGHPEPDLAHNVSAKHRMSLLSLFFFLPNDWLECQKHENLMLEMKL